jgi:serine/threonine protein kinase
MRAAAENDVLAGRYRLVERLAVGGMGEVWKASMHGPAGFERAVAVKLLHAAHEGEAERVEMFLDEARMTALLDHPNIVQTIELGRHAGQYFIVMEYIDGLSVAQLLERLARSQRSLDVASCAHILAGLLNALEHAHQASSPAGTPLRIVHRDVCPRNVLVTRDGTVKLTDFGIARGASNVHVTRENVLKGKLDRMAPEQLRLGHVDGRTDVYAAGLLLYELLTGRSPFAHVLSVPHMQLAHRERAYLPSAHVPDLDPRLDQVVARAMASRLQDRFDGAGAMAEAVRTFVPQPLAVRRGLGKLVSGLAVATGTTPPPSDEGTSVTAAARPARLPVPPPPEPRDTSVDEYPLVDEELTASGVAKKPRLSAADRARRCPRPCSPSGSSAR